MTLSRLGFRVQALYKVKQHGVLRIARQRISFIIASLSLFAFVFGNMVGQHGWYAFWKTVLGAGDDVSIVFVGTVSPIARVPDYSRWSQYGGDAGEHLFRQVPANILVPLPKYDPMKLRDRTGENMSEAVYSIGNLGSYATGDDHGGSHVGVDIRVPVGTPVVSIANGIVEKAVIQEYGYGHYVMIRHPNVPDPDVPGKTTTLYSVYGHLDSVLVREGQIVHKGEQIATSGKTGLATGPHLHFQIDKASAPFHPYWPFTSTEANQASLTFNQAINSGLHQERGELYTLSPVLYVQAHESDVQQTLASKPNLAAPSSAAEARQPVTLKTAVGDRLKQRMARVGATRPLDTGVIAIGGASPEQVQSPAISQVKTAEVGQLPSTIVSGSNTDVDHLNIVHSGKLSRSWQKVKIQALDSNEELVKSPSFSQRLYVIPEFGDAEIRPTELSPLDFINGVATVSVLSRSNKTLFISTRGAFTAQSSPMIFER